MQKALTVFLACAVLSLGCGGERKAAPASKTQKPIKAEFVIVEDTQYNAGKEDPQLTAGLTQFLNAEPSVSRLTVQEMAADEKLAKIDVSFLPLYLIKKTPEVRAKFEKPLAQGYIQETDDFIVLAHQTRQGVYADKPVQKDVMDLFVMTQCPYGVRAENLVIQAKKNGTFPTGKTLNLRYIVDYNPTTKTFNSMHGSGEWEEAVRQLLIAKYYPQKFWKYLEIRNQDYRSSRWDKAMEKAGIDTHKIMKKFDGEGLELLKKQAAYAKEFGVSASPTVVWEGKVQMDLGSAATLEGFGFFNPRQPNGAAVAAPAGHC